ncbi:hypothetical protein [Crocosphaera sp.]|uniref:hypothetical protein n=1 Tax=Crocosphaera sp. TaxID=2729996 RepID=UPI00261C136D|nr:hypothetical protein [Crocosphaera sp.]MDJ0582655.1 hypothetical protein [Crocosphaera sp.]
MTNSGSNLREDGNDLVKLNYSDFLGKVLEVLNSDTSQQLFKISEDNKRLLMNVDELAYQVSQLSINDPFISQPFGTKCASINFIEGTEKTFSEQLHLIQAKVKELLKNELKQDISIENYLEKIAVPLENLKGKVNDNISFNYPFDQKYTNLQKQRLTLPKDEQNILPLLRLHKLSITVKQPTRFLNELRSSLKNYVEIHFEEEKEDLIEDILEPLFENQDKDNNDIYKLKKLMKEESLGKIKKAASIKYLEFLYDQVKNDQDAVYLKDLIRRLKLLEAYINDESKPDDYYKVFYQGVEFDFRQFFNNSYAFDSLPIISQIEGYLGEMNDRDQDKQEFIFGMKLKLNGQVQTSKGETSFEYHTKFLDLDKKENKDKLSNEIEKGKFIRKVLRIVFLYYFVFASRSKPLDKNKKYDRSYDISSELTYDPVENFEQQILPILKGNDDQAKKKLFNDIKRGFEQYNISFKLQKLRELLIDYIESKKIFNTKPYTLTINISQGILEKDSDKVDNNNTLFKPELNNKEGLKYISVNDSSKIDTETLCGLSVDIKFTDIQYFRSNEQQLFSMKYDLDGINTIPMLLTPQEDQCREIYKQGLKNQASLVCNYNHERLKEEIFNQEDNPNMFWYQLTFSLLTYLSLKILLYQSKDKLFIPLLRLHLTDKDDASPEEVFMRSFSYVLSHILNEKYDFSSQGICIKNINFFKNRNSLSSLYSTIPKIFQFDNYTPELDKLAIIVVSSWECDRKYTNTYQIKNMIGEVICLERQEDKTIRLYNQGTFSSNYDTEDIYKKPDILVNKISELYDQGYRHFLYIAKSPYSNYLNITGENRELYFMSPDVIKELKSGKNDIHIYPIFFDKYYVVKLQKINAASLYIQDTTELTNLVNDKADASQRSLVFFNLFNGITVVNDNSYNGVISYITLLNIYNDTEHEKTIYQGLINDTQFKKDILNYLTLFHFSRYQATATRNKPISLKLDPYQNLIGDKSVGQLSVFNHIKGNRKIEFNSLAFLTEVRKYLYDKP